MSSAPTKLARMLTTTLSYTSFATCEPLLDPVAGTSLPEPMVPALGEAWGYIISADETVGAGGNEGTLGEAACTERSNFAPCP